MERDRLKGYICECCDQLVKEYDRPLYDKPVTDLIALYWLDMDYPDGYWHITDLNTASSGGDFAKLRHWDLIEEAPNENKKKSHSGLWAITDKGRRFVRREIRIPKYARVYDGKFRFFVGDMITIDQALKNDFDYERLMS